LKCGDQVLSSGKLPDEFQDVFVVCNDLITTIIQIRLKNKIGDAPS